MTRVHRLSAAESAHKPHTERARIGAAFTTADGFDLTAWDARQHFIRAIEDQARRDPVGRCAQLFADLAAVTKPRGARRYDDAALAAWAGEYHLLWRGAAASWCIASARATLAVWRVTGPFIGLVMAELPAGRVPLDAEACRLRLPEIAWNPFGVSRREDGRGRVESRADALARVAAMAGLELDRIERAARRTGGLRAAAGSRPRQIDLTAFNVAVRYQIGRESVLSMAGGRYEPARGLDKAIQRVLTLIGLDRRGRRGRPRK